jgi:hypothetical protein
VAFLNGSLSHALSLARLSFRLPQLFTPTLYRRLELPLPQQRLTWPLEARDGRGCHFRYGRNSVDLHAKAWWDTFRDFGHDFELKAVRNQIGKGGISFCRLF